MLGRRSTLLAAGALATLLAVAPAAHAVYPGKNGKLVIAKWGESQRNLYVANVDGTGEVQVTNDAELEFTPSASPDGARFVYSRAGDIWMRNIDGSGPVQLTNDSRSEITPAFTPDNGQIWWVRVTGSTPHVWKMNLDGSAQEQVSAADKPERLPVGFPQANAGNQAMPDPFMLTSRHVYGRDGKTLYERMPWGGPGDDECTTLPTGFGAICEDFTSGKNVPDLCTFTSTGTDCSRKAFADACNALAEGCFRTFVCNDGACALTFGPGTQPSHDQLLRCDVGSGPSGELVCKNGSFMPLGTEANQPQMDMACSQGACGVAATPPPPPPSNPCPPAPSIPRPCADLEISEMDVFAADGLGSAFLVPNNGFAGTDYSMSTRPKVRNNGPDDSQPLLKVTHAPPAGAPGGRTINFFGEGPLRAPDASTGRPGQIYEPPLRAQDLLNADVPGTYTLTAVVEGSANEFKPDNNTRTHVVRVVPPVDNNQAPVPAGVRQGQPGSVGGTAGPSTRAQGSRARTAQAERRVSRVEIALLRSAGSKASAPRCRWLSSASGRFKSVKPLADRSCGSAVWLKARGTRHWSFKLRKGLPAGSYTLYSRAFSGVGVRETVFSKRDRNRQSFKVKRRKR